MDAYETALSCAAEDCEQLIGGGPLVTAQMDQAGQRLYEILARLDVDLHDPVQARAAFAGAYSMYVNLNGLTVPTRIGAACIVEIGCYPHLHRVAVG